MKINWKLVWEKFNKWHESTIKTCPTCKSHSTEAEWDDQQKAIKRIVDAQLRKGKP